MTETEPYDIDLSRVIDAPPARVYQAFVDPDQFAAWYGPTGFPVDRASVELDARVGGMQRFAMVGEADPSMRTAFEGSFVEVIENELLSSSGAWAGIPGQASAWPSNLRGVPGSRWPDAARRARGSSPARDGRSRPPSMGDDAAEAGGSRQPLRLCGDPPR